MKNHDLKLVLLLSALVVLIFGLALCGCRSTPCIPQVEIQEVNVPQPCVVTIEELPPLALPEYPPFNADDPKEWALQVEQIDKQREALLNARIDALNFKIAEHNKLEPRCVQ